MYMIKIIFGIISPKFLDNHPKFIFNPWYKLHNNKAKLRFVFREKKPCYPCTIINKSYELFSSWNIRNIRGTTHMYEQDKKENYLFYRSVEEKVHVCVLLTHTPQSEKSTDLNIWTKETKALWHGMKDVLIQLNFFSDGDW